MNRADSTPIRESGTLSITPGVIKRIEPTSDAFTLRDTQQPGLILIVRPKSKTWYIDYRANGRRRKYRLGSTADLTTNEARKLAKSLKVQIAAGADPAAERAQAKVETRKAQETAEKAAKRTVEAYLTETYAPDHLDHTKGGRATEKALRSAFPDLMKRDMETLTKEEMQRWANKRIKEGVKPATINRQRVMLMALLNHALAHDAIEVNPLAKWKRMKVEESHRVRYLGSRDDLERFKKDERTRFMEALAKSPPDIKAIVNFALLTGCRRAEIFGLRWKDISFRDRMITVEGSNTKTLKTRRVPMNSTLEKILRDWRGDVVNIDGSVLVFPSPRTGGKRSDLKRAWATLCERAKVQDFHFHDCRHDCASRLVQAGVPLKKIAEILGHASVSVTEKHYAHLQPKHMADVMEMLS